MSATVREFDFSVDLLRNLIWQYNNAPALTQLLQSKQDWYTVNHNEFWTNWVRDVFDLTTANDFGLSVWAVILDMPLIITPDVDGTKPIFGYGAANTRVNYNNGNYAGNSAIELTTEQKRLVLRLRYFQLTTRGSVTEINFIMKTLFGASYVSDGLDMRARYVFAEPLTSALELVLTSYDLLPRPAGVMVDYVISGEADGFGYGRFRQNFNNGNYYHAT